MRKHLKGSRNENARQLSLAIEEAPPRVRAHGLRAAHPRPLVDVRDDQGAGRIVRSLRVRQGEAWEFPDVGYPHGWRSWAAVVVDVDAPEKLREILHGQTGLTPNWCVFNRRNGHAHACYPLARPVHEHPEANTAPLEYLAAVERKLIAALDGDPSYSGALARNPMARPRWRTSTLWLRAEPWELAELDEAATAALPRDWRAAKAASGAVGRNVALFAGLMAWAGREANRYQSIMAQAVAINAGFEIPLPAAEARATARSVAKYRRKWERRGWHSPAWIRKQAVRGRMSGEVRRRKNAERDRKIIDAYDQGMTQAALAREFGLSRRWVNVIIRGGEK